MEVKLLAQDDPDLVPGLQHFLLPRTAHLMAVSFRLLLFPEFRARRSWEIWKG